MVLMDDYEKCGDLKTLNQSFHVINDNEKVSLSQNKEPRLNSTKQHLLGKVVKV